MHYSCLFTHLHFFHFSEIAVTGIVLGMTKLGSAASFAGILFLTFYCADATSMLIAHLSSDLIAAICLASGILGFFTMVSNEAILLTLEQTLRLITFLVDYSR